MKNIGIVGLGYVGTAVESVFSKYFNIKSYDTQKNKGNVENLGDLIKYCDLIFVCVPTPMKKDGSCDTSIVESVVKDINDIYEDDGYVISKILAIKSTIPPGTTDKFAEKYKNLGFVFNPEFLTEANFIDDFKNQNRIIVGGKRPHSTFVKNIYSKVFPNEQPVNKRIAKGKAFIEVRKQSKPIKLNLLQILTNLFHKN